MHRKRLRKLDEEDINQFPLRRKIICYIKIKFADLLINYIYLKNHQKIFEKIKKKQIDTFFLYRIILVHFWEIILQIKNKDIKAYENLIKIQDDQSFVDKLLDLYSQTNIFTYIIEFPLVAKFSENIRRTIRRQRSS